MRLLPEAECGSALVYVPKWRGGGELGQKPRDICNAVKRGDEGSVDRLASYIVKHMAKYPENQGVSDVLAEDAVLVPMPKCAPHKAGTLWPALLLVEALVNHGIGSCCEPLLERAVKVKKSATAPSGDWPMAVTHLQSFRVSPPLAQPERIVIVDDVITRGATMLAAVSAVSDAFPWAQVRGFAFFRTASDDAIDKIQRSCLSQIRLCAEGHTDRDP